MKKIFFCFLWYANITFASAIPKAIGQPLPDQFWITVFVHGSFSLKPHLSINNIFKMLYDTIEESVYYRATEINRRDPFFYKNQAMGELGLHKVDISKPTTIIAAPTVALAYETVSELAGYPSSDQYYTFGWSGLVSHKLRYIEAGFLYKDLVQLIKQFQKKGHHPLLRIVSYSHGGNLALQLGAVHQTKEKNDQLCVDELHIMGTPIQVETDYLITSPVFKKIYNWYSLNDGVQTLDFFSFKRFFSKKRFKDRKVLRLPEKLIQIQLKVSDFKPKHKKNLDHMPINDKELKKYYREIPFDPGHFELWFMGWTTLRYRKNFPTYPLPTLTFLPLITQCINNDPQTPHDIVVSIQPYFNRIEIYPYKNRRTCKYRAQYPFVDPTILKNMKEYAQSFTPDNYTLAIYNQKVSEAIKIVDHELSMVKKITKLEKNKKIKLAPTIHLHDTSCKHYYGHIAPSKVEK